MIDRTWLLDDELNELLALLILDPKIRVEPSGACKTFIEAVLWIKSGQ